MLKHVFYQTHGFLSTGEQTNHKDIVKVTYASAAVADDGRDSFLGLHGGSGHCSTTHAYIAGGVTSNQVTTISR